VYFEQHPHPVLRFFIGSHVTRPAFCGLAHVSTKDIDLKLQDGICLIPMHCTAVRNGRLSEAKGGKSFLDTSIANRVRSGVQI
jgi:hypothetical protein